jgi:GNAT superfamily N-acetyltransferase
MTSIREIEIERDAPALVDLVRQTNPTAVINLESLVHRLQTAPPRAKSRTWVAEEAGRIVGRANCYLSLFSADPHTAEVHVTVFEDHRRRGVGSALYDTGLEYARSLGVDRVLTTFPDSPGGVAFAEQRGFVFVRAETVSALDPRTVAEQPVGDVRAVSTIDPRLAYVVDIEATYDMPSTEEFDGMAYEEWTEHVLDHPLFAPEGSFVAFADGDAAAVSLLTVDRESGRAANMFTGTRAAYRGRGLALSAKLASIAWAAANGVTVLVTYNDAMNAPMLAVNKRLGYEPGGRRVEYLLDLS